MTECIHCRDWGKYERHEDHVTTCPCTNPATTPTHLGPRCEPCGAVVREVWDERVEEWANG